MTSTLRQSFDDWDIPRPARFAIAWTPLLGAVGLALARVHKKTYRVVLSDDGPVEWAQFACFILAMIAAFGIAVYRRRQGHRWQSALFTIVGTGLLFVSGEEISWGQRILDIETPDSLIDINKQNEITLHNVGDVLVWMNRAMLLIALVALAAPFLNRVAHLERRWSDADRLFVPPVFLAPAFIVVLAYRIVRSTVWTDSGFTVTKYGEWAEFCLAFAAAVFLWSNFRWLRGQATAVMPSE